MLDLGSGVGTVGPECYPETSIILLDSMVPLLPCGDLFVQADAGRLPFSDRIFDAVIANHCLEHMDQVACVLKEIGRVLQREGGNAKFIAVFNYALRLLDRLFRTRTSVYGWAFYFGNIKENIATVPWKNVCFNCGAGHSETSLIVNSKVRRGLLGVRSYNCPNCGAWNLFTQDEADDPNKKKCKAQVEEKAKQVCKEAEDDQDQDKR
ncbi:MAG: class I SAM-dependent methyltransferase [Acidobacteriota bacterium]|nr:class I SAM-dependent methyltransferase [Acidobacteriota bacterium]